MKVVLAVSVLMDAVTLFAGGTVLRLMTSRPPTADEVPEFCRLVTAASERFGSTAMELGGPEVAMEAPVGVVVVTAPGSKTVRSM